MAEHVAIPVTESIERVITDIGCYREATERLIEALLKQVSSSDDDIAVMRGGISMADKMQRSRSSELSRKLTRRLEEFEEVRRQIRTSITAALLDEGLSISEVGDAFGVTRQLANRFAKDARKANA